VKKQKGTAKAVPFHFKGFEEKISLFEKLHLKDAASFKV
jgi:hypothetical protein